MQLKPRLTRRVSALAAALPLASVLAVLPIAGTTGTANAATGNYNGNAALDLVHANVTIPGLQVADAGVAPAQSNVNSQGLADPKGKQSYADATNVSTNLLESGALGNLLVESKQSALPDNAKSQEDSLTGDIDLSPLADLSVADTSAHARWVTNGCLAVGSPISTATTRLAHAAVLPNAPALGTLVDTVGLNNGPVSTTSAVAITAGSGIAHRGLGSSAATQVAQISLLGGQVVVKVVGTPVLTAEATGKPGGAKVTYKPALLTVSIAGNDITLDPDNPLPTIALPGNPLLNLSLPAVTQTVAANGTKASGDTAILHVDVLSALGTPPLASVDIGKSHADATVPSGGIDCTADEQNPLREAHKDLSAASVNPGQTFTYTVAVPNRGSEDITNVKVVDTPAPAGLVLEKSVPAPASSSGNTYTYNLGTLAPNETKNIVMTFKVPTTVAIGTHFHNTAVITGTYKGTDYSKTATVDGPSVDSPGAGSCSIIASNKGKSHLKVVPGETFNYYVHVFNTGGEPCTNVTVTDVLESGVSFVSATQGGTLSGKTVTWKVGDVAAGASVTLAATVKTVATSGSLHNKAHITADGATPADPEVNGPLVTDQSVLASASPAVRAHTGDLAFTGLSVVSTFAALILVFLGLGIRRYTQSRLIFRP